LADTRKKKTEEHAPTRRPASNGWHPDNRPDFAPGGVGEHYRGFDENPDESSLDKSHR